MKFFNLIKKSDKKYNFGFEYIESQYKLYTINSKSGNIYFQNRKIGNINKITGIHKCEKCGSNYKVDLHSILEVLVLDIGNRYSICLNCGRVYKGNVFNVNFQCYPDDDEEFIDKKKIDEEIKNYNDLFELDNGNVFGMYVYTGHSGVVPLIPLNEIANYENIYKIFKRGYASYREDKYGLITGIRYDPISLASGKIERNLILYNDGYQESEYIKKLKKKIDRKYRNFKKLDDLKYGFKKSVLTKGFFIGLVFVLIADAVWAYYSKNIWGLIGGLITYLVLASLEAFIYISRRNKRKFYNRNIRMGDK